MTIFQAILNNGFDYRIDFMLCEQITAKKRKIINGFSLIAAMEIMNVHLTVKLNTISLPMMSGSEIQERCVTCSRHECTTQFLDWEASKLGETKT